ncbi:MAG: hypothetical protein HKN76_01030 [Saprospiraceae bacterium]|nr:hypothetical protein [Saprospiraceae bacterium]
MNGLEVLIPLVGTVAVFGCIGFISYLYLKGRNKERMALIETGQDASLFRESRGIHQNLKWGFLAIAIGVALFIGHFLEEYTSMDDGFAYFPMIFLLGGGALLLYYKKAKDDGLEL